MNKYFVLGCFVVFMIYSVAGLMIEIPKIVNDIFYAIIFIAGMIIAIFYLELGSNLKSRILENRQKMIEKKKSK